MSRKLSSTSGGKANTTDTKRSRSSPVEIAPLVGGSDVLDGFDADGKSILINKGNWDWAGWCFMKTQGNWQCASGPYSEKENKRNRAILINGNGKPVNAEMFCSLISFTLETLKGAGHLVKRPQSVDRVGPWSRRLRNYTNLSGPSSGLDLERRNTVLHQRYIIFHKHYLQYSTLSNGRIMCRLFSILYVKSTPVHDSFQRPKPPRFVQRAMAWNRSTRFINVRYYTVHIIHSAC